MNLLKNLTFSLVLNYFNAVSLLQLEKHVGKSEKYAAPERVCLLRTLGNVVWTLLANSCWFSSKLRRRVLMLRLSAPLRSAL